MLEDLQWSDEATRALLDDLLPVAETHAVAFVLVLRSDPGHPAWQLVDRARRRFRRQFVEVDLEPLADAEAAELANADAGATLPQTLMQMLVERVGGNPYFVLETLQDLRESGALEVEGGRAALVGDVSLPAALQEAAQARLDRLDGDARDVITTAAVIGRTFDLPLLERLLPRARLRPALSELLWLQLLVEDGSGAEPEYRFRHGLLQEVAYEGLLDAHRRELHLRVGEALGELYGESTGEIDGLLAHHFSEADDPDRAIHYLLRAGDAARAVFARDEAVESYRRALGFMEQTAGDGRGRETLLKIGLTHHLAYDFRAANEAFAQAFEWPAQPLTRLEPSEPVSWCMPAAWDGALTPGHAYSWPAFLMSRNLFSGLLAPGPGLAVEPGVAERFTVSDDGLTYRFTLRPDARWSDGVAVTAGDFAFAFERITDEGLAAASWLEGVSARALDARTLEVHLRHARNEFLYVICQPPFFPWPRHVHERIGRDWHLQRPLVGNGPFVLSSREPILLLEAAPTWHGSRGNVARVTVELAASTDVAEDGWRRGAFDVVDQVLAPHPVADQDTVVERSPGVTTCYLGFVAVRPPFDDPRIRRALAHGVDTRRPAALLGATAALGGGMLPPIDARPFTTDGPGVRPSIGPDPCWPRPASPIRPPLARSSWLISHSPPTPQRTSPSSWRPSAFGPVCSSADSDPELERAIAHEAHAFVWAWGADYPDPGHGFLEPMLAGQPTLYRDALTHGAAGSGGTDARRG